MDFAVPDLWTTLIWAVIAGAAMWALFWLRARQRRIEKEMERRSHALDQIDTVSGWPPQATRVLTSSQSQALHLLRRALPERLILAQVPLSHFLRVPTRHSNLEWMRRIGRVTADLMICDAQGRVLSVIDLRRTGRDHSEQARKRHERMARVLEAAQIPFHVWDEARLPAASTVRRAFGPDAVRQGDGLPSDTSPMTIAPLDQKDPPVSGWFDELHATRPTKLDSVEVIHSDSMLSDFAPTRSPEVARAR